MLAFGSAAVGLAARRAARRQETILRGEALARELHCVYIWYADDFRDTIRVESSVRMIFRKWRPPEDRIVLLVTSTSRRKPQDIRDVAENWLGERGVAGHDTKVEVFLRR